MRRIFRSSILPLVLSVALFLIGLLLCGFSSSGVAGIFICVSLLIVYYWLAIITVSKFYGLKLLKQESKWSIICSIAIAILSVLIFVLVVKQDNYIYYWDYINYWIKTDLVVTGLQENPSQTLTQLYVGINTTEYNDLPAFLLAVPLKIIGSSFLRFSTLVFTLFLIPACFLVALSIKKIVIRLGLENPPLPLVFALTLIFPRLLWPILYGQVDAVFLLPLACMLLIAAEWRFERFDLSSCLLFAAIILEVFLLRRTSIVFLAAFVPLVIAVSIGDIILRYSPGKKKNALIVLLKSIIIVGVCVVVVIMLFFQGLLQQSLFNNFSFAYSAYGQGDLFDKFIQLLKKFGLLLVLLAVFGTVLLAKNKESRFFGLLLLLLCAAVFLIVSSIQSMDKHHVYLIAFQVIILAQISIWYFYPAVHQLVATNRHQAYAKFGFFCLCLLVFFGNFAQFSLGIFQSNNDVPIFDEDVYRPKVRYDKAEVNNLVSILEDLSSDGSSIYVLSSSVAFNEDILRFASFPAKKNPLPTMLPTAHVDLRNGFPVQFVTADLIVVPNPPQYHLGEHNQRIVGLIASLFNQGSKIKQKYELVGNYPLDGMSVSIYRRIAPLDNTDLDSLTDMFNQYYSEYPELFNDRIQDLKS